MTDRPEPNFNLISHADLVDAVSRIASVQAEILRVLVVHEQRKRVRMDGREDTFFLMDLRRYLLRSQSIVSDLMAKMVQRDE